MAYTAWSVVFGEQPTAAKWNQLGANDAGFKDGTNIDDDAILARHLANQIVAPANLNLDGKYGEVLTAQATTSSTFTNLATVGPSITVNVGPNGILLIGCSAAVSNDTTGNGGAMALDITGANTIAADQSLTGFGITYNGATDNSRTNLLVGLNAGSTTLVAKYRRYGGGGTATFTNRRIWALPL